MSKIRLIAAALTATIVATTTIALVVRRPASRTSELPVQPPAVSAATVPPRLYCEFYNFTRNATVVSFYFSVDLRQRTMPSFTELFVVEPDGTKTEIGIDDPNSRWIYGSDDGAPVISSPDGDTRIVLYGLKPKTPGITWIEAGVRSDTYRNLEGKCRQSGF